MRKLTVLLGAVVLAVAAVAVVAGTAGPAAAGGWAVPAFDPVPPLVAGESTPIGLTVLQHGVSPVSVDDVALTFVGADGVPHRFPAEPEGPLGHYVATVTLAAGTYSWSVQPGWFPDHELGSVVVTAASDGSEAAMATAPPASDDVSSGRALARVALPFGAVLAAAFAVASARPGRRRALAAGAS
jgi:hypothetical protein